MNAGGNMFKRKHGKKQEQTENSSGRDKLKVSDEEKNKIETEQKDIELSKPEVIRRSRAFSTIYLAYNNVLKMVSKYLKDDPEIFDWVISSYIAPELGKLSESDLSEINSKMSTGVILDHIGSISLNKETFSEWGKKYKEESILRQIEHEKAENLIKKDLERKLGEAKHRREIERLAAEEEKRRKDEEEIKQIKLLKEKEQKRLNKIEEYKEYFKNLNKAQQKAELDWFKKKLVEKYTTSEDEADDLVHQLEMISLAD